MTLERRTAFELAPCPEFYGGQTQWQTFGGYRQAGMHQDAALGQRILQSVSLYPVRIVALPA